jgi:multidrug efflux pump subunit AcrA (membrane-fusion protein)
LAARVRTGQTARIALEGSQSESTEAEDDNADKMGAPADHEDAPADAPDGADAGATQADDENATNGPSDAEADGATEPDTAAEADSTVAGDAAAGDHPAADETDHPSGQAEAAAAEPEAEGEPILGKVVSVGQIVDPATGNLPVRVQVDNTEGRIAIGQILPVTIVVHRRVEELVVPSTALVDLGEGPLLMVVRDGKVMPLQPKSVATHGIWTIVSGTDLEPGEQVVVEGGFNLPEGTEVEVEPQAPAVAEAAR